MKSYAKVLFFVCFFTFAAYAQEPQQEAEIPENLEENTRELVTKIREDLAKNRHSVVFSSLSSKLSNPKASIIKTWFLYVMWAESAKITGNLPSVISRLPSSGGFRLFSRALSFWNSGDALSAARLLSSIDSKEPSLSYLIGKLYMSIGKLHQGAGYLYLSAKMREAPYGLYYAGLGQNSIGKFSKASSFLSDASSMLLEGEGDLAQKIELQQAVSLFGREKFEDAYKTISIIYEKDPITTLRTLDPGVILTAMNKHAEAKDFWNQALKKSLPAAISAQIRKNLSYNKRLLDPEYPPLWLRH